MNRTPDEQLIYNALSQVHTPRCDIEKGVRLRLAADSGRQRRALPRRTLLMAAALALFLIIGAAAASVSGLWQHFWPSAHIPSSAVTSPGVSQTAGDYTLTLEDVMADDSGIILLLSLSRSDGGPIDPDARLSGHVMHAGLLADGQSFGGGGMDTPVLSEDGTALFFCCELEDHRLSAGETLSGKQLTFTADGVVIPLYSDNALGYQPEQAVSLAALGALDIPEGMDHAMLLARLVEAGFLPEKEESAKEALEQERHIVSVPAHDFDRRIKDNLDKLLAAKGGLIMAALGVDRLQYSEDHGYLAFDLYDSQPEQKELEACTDLLNALYTTAREQVRVTAKAQADIDNPKYAMRCFLLKLGFIGPEYKETRSLLLSRLPGNASFKSGK